VSLEIPEQALERYGKNTGKTANRFSSVKEKFHAF